MSLKSFSIFFLLIVFLVASGYGWYSYKKYQEEQDVLLWHNILEKIQFLSENYASQIAAYQLYLKQYPEGKYSATAYLEVTRAMALQKAELLWAEAQKKTVQSLQDYSDAIQAYQKYLEWAPKGKYALKAKEKILELGYHKEEESFWLLCFSKAEMEKTYEPKIAAYQGYLQKYPSGKYKEKATATILSLESSLEEEKYYRQILQEARSYYDKGDYEEAYDSCLKYSKKYPQGNYSSLIALEIKEIQRKKETLFFEEKAKSSVTYLERANFERAHREIISYLSEYPEPLYNKEARKLLQEISQAEEEALYQKATRFVGNLPQRIQSLEEFLAKYPEGKYSQQIQKLLKEYKKEYIARKILRTPPEGLKKEESLKGASQKLLDLLELVQDSWKSKDQERSRKQLQTAYLLVDKGSPIIETLDTLQEYLYFKEIEILLQKGDSSAENLCKDAVSRFPDSQKFKNFLQKAIQENISPKLRESYSIALQLQEKKQYEEAIALYNTIFPQMNDHYKKLVELNRQECKDLFSEREYKKAYEWQEKGDYEKALESYIKIKSQMSEKYAKILEKNTKECQDKLFETYYALARKAYQEKDIAQCLQAILKAEKLGKNDIYLSNLKLQITDKVYTEYHHKIVKALEEQRIALARDMLSEVYEKYNIGEEWDKKFSDFKAFLDAHDKAHEEFRKGNNKECINFSKIALKYYENAQIRKILLQVEMENEKYYTYLSQAEEYLSEGKIEKTQEVIQKLKSMRGDIPDIRKMENLWFMQMAKRDKGDFIEKLLYKIPVKGGEWVLDMASSEWRNLSYQRQSELAALYQKVYAQQKDLSVEKMFRSPQISFELVLIPPGRYLRGSPAGEKDRYLDEQYHLVTISKAFWMSKYEITQDQWFQVTQERPWQGKQDKASTSKITKGNTSKHPASYVSWKDIESKFFSRLEEKFALPTEAQWEYSCRAGTTTRFYWGDDIAHQKIEDYAWYSENTEKKGNPFPQDVGQKIPNAWHLYDMSGNLYEWCQDWRGEYPATEQFDPSGPLQGEERVYRGGMWFHNARFCRSAFRASYLPDYRGYYTGFRLVQEINDEKIVIASLNWTGSTAIEQIMKYVLEKELRIPTEIKNVPERNIWPELQEGTVDIFPDLWLPNRIALFREYVEERKTVIAKVSYPDAYQGFYIPSKVAKKYDIKNVFDLKGKENLFDVNGDGKGDIWVGDGNWDSTAINISKIREYGIDLEIFQSDEKRFYPVLKENMQAEKPILFYFWEPGWVTYTYDVTLLEEPPYQEDKWIFSKGRPELTKISCSYPKATIYVGISKKLQKRIPKAYKFFMNWYIPINEVSYLIAEIEDIPDNPAKDPAEVAKEWVRKHPDIIKNWLRDL